MVNPLQYQSSLRKEPLYVQPKENEKWIESSDFFIPNTVEFEYDIDKPSVNDIALIKLLTPIRFSEDVRPICISSNQGRCLIDNSSLLRPFRDLAKQTCCLVFYNCIMI